jgi:hypothetical protein
MGVQINQTTVEDAQKTANFVTVACTEIASPRQRPVRGRISIKDRTFFDTAKCPQVVGLLDISLGCYKEGKACLLFIGI